MNVSSCATCVTPPPLRAGCSRPDGSVGIMRRVVHHHGKRHGPGPTHAGSAAQQDNTTAAEDAQVRGGLTEWCRQPQLQPIHPSRK
jgi:hypothetical protein